MIQLKALGEISKINEFDKKSLVERALELSEEVGKVSEAVLSYARVHGCSNNSKSEADIAKECIDVIIMAQSILAAVDTPFHSIQNIYDEKIEEWKDEVGVIEDVYVYSIAKEFEHRGYCTFPDYDGLPVGFNELGAPCIIVERKRILVDNKFIVKLKDFKSYYPERMVKFSYDKLCKDIGITSKPEFISSLDGLMFSSDLISLGWLNIGHKGKLVTIHKDWVE